MNQQGIDLQLSHATRENYILQKQIESKFFQMQLLLDHLPVILMAINKDLIFELVQGDGLKVLETNEIALIGNMLEDIYEGNQLEGLIQDAFHGDTKKAIVELKSGYYFYCTFTPQFIENTIERVFIIANYVNHDTHSDLPIIRETLF